MRAGMMRHRISLQRRGTGQNNFGEEIQSWTDDTMIWANIMPIRGSEYNFARQAHSEVTHRIRTRYCKLADGTRPTADNCRLRYYDHKAQVNRYFDVQDIHAPYERKIYLDWMCIEEN